MIHTVKGKDHLLRVTTSYYCAGAIFESRFCVKAAPIIKWMVGLTYSDIQYRLRNKEVTFEWLY